MDGERLKAEQCDKPASSDTTPTGKKMSGCSAGLFRFFVEAGLRKEVRACVACGAVRGLLAVHECVLVDFYSRASRSDSICTHTWELCR